MFLDEQRASYELLAVIHRTDDGVTAALRLPGKVTPVKRKWFKVDGGDIACVNREKAIDPRTAYMVFYEKVRTPVV